MKKITRTIPTTTIKAIGTDEKMQPINKELQVIGEELTEEKARKEAMKNNLLYLSHETSTTLYEISLEKFIENASIVTDEQTENETETNSDKETETKTAEQPVK